MTSDVEVTKGSHNGITVPGIVVKNKPNVSSEQQLLLDKEVSGSAREKKLLAFLNEYLEVMNSAEDKGEVGHKMQVRLYRTYADIIENSDTVEFRQLWSILLLFAKLNKKTVFCPNMINRYSYLWDIGEEKFRAFQSVNNIVLLTADPATRQRNIRFQIDFSKSLDSYFSQEGAQRVTSYYK